MRVTGNSIGNGIRIFFVSKIVKVALLLENTVVVSLKLFKNFTHSGKWNLNSHTF